MDQSLIFIIIASIIGLWMTWGIGANDLANIMSPAMGSKAISVKQAIFIAVIFEMAGAFLGGNQVTETVRNGVLNGSLLINTPNTLIYGMLSVLFSGALWINFASFLGMPVSITNTVIGALVGVGAIALGLGAINWQIVGYIALSWICSPMIAAVFAFLMFSSIERTILNSKSPLKAAKFYIPIYLFLVGIVLSLMTVVKGLQYFAKDMHNYKVIISVCLSVLIIVISGFIAMKHFFSKHESNRHMQFIYIEAMFSVLMAFTACAMVFAHGSNDVAIAVGPIVGIIGVSNTKEIFQDHLIINSMLFFGCIGVLLGLFMYGRKVIATVGHSITILTPSRAFAATLAAASTVVVSTSTGIPVSATQTLVGAVLGVGLVRGVHALNLNVLRNIFMSWIITIPAASILATIFFYGLRWGFG